jgi:hypothetical protein
MAAPGSLAPSDPYSPGHSLPGWGNIGDENRFLLLQLPGGQRSYGVERLVSFGYQYKSIPDLSLIPLWASETPAGGRKCFRMALHAESEFRFFSLSQLGKTLQKEHRDSPKGVPAEDDAGLKAEFVELNWLVDELLEVTKVLHAHHRGLGLTDPNNILYYYDPEGQVHLVLPDLFFQYEGAPPIPMRLTDRKGFQFLWSEPATEEFDAYAYHTKAFGPADDLRMLARMFAWVLTGEPRKELCQDQRYGAPCWPILRRAARAGSADPEVDPIDDVAVLQHCLRQDGHALDEHFKRPYQEGCRIRVKKSCPRLLRYLKVGGALLVLAIAAVGAFMIPGRFEGARLPPEPSRLCDCPADSPIQDVLKNRQEKLDSDFRRACPDSKEERVGLDFAGQSINQLFDNLQEQVGVIKEAHRVVTANNREPTEEESDCLQREAGRFLACLADQWEVLYAKFDDDTMPDPVGLCERFRDIYCEFNKLPFIESLEEPQWQREYEDTLTKVYGIELCP